MARNIHTHVWIYIVTSISYRIRGIGAFDKKQHIFLDHAIGLSSACESELEIILPFLVYSF